MEELKPSQNKVKRVAYTQQFPIAEEGEMYESPINVFERNICNKLTEEKENLVIAAVLDIGVSVDKEELEKALRYDRQQYEKGYADAKSEQPERKKGKWIYCEDMCGVDGYRCDKCGFHVPWDYKHKVIDYIKEYHFCPNCGADMREENDGSAEL